MRGEPVTLRLARQLVALQAQPLPLPVLDTARRLIADTLLVAAAGQASPLAGDIRSVLQAAGGPCQGWFDVAGIGMSPLDAAFINSYHAALLGYGSINAKAHADAVCLPAAWAVAEQLGSSGAQLTQAFVLASEVVGRLSHGASSRSAGWSHTAIYGGIGAAVAAGLLLELPAEQLAHAMALAMGQAAGTQQASLESAPSRRLQPAFAARNGVFAAQLAAAGAVGPSQAMEGKFGLRALYEAGDDKQLFEGLGQDWRLLDTCLKPYPISACSQAAVEALLHLQRTHGCGEEDILEIVAYVSGFMFRYVGAEFSLEGDLEMLAQFNLRYHLASAILRGPTTLAHLRPAALADAQVARVMRKVHLRVDPRNKSDFAPVTVSFTLRDGSMLDYVQEQVPGSRQQPISSAAWALKAKQCGVEGGIDGAALVRLLDGLAAQPSVRGLLRG